MWHNMPCWLIDNAVLVCVNSSPQERLPAADFETDRALLPRFKHHKGRDLARRRCMLCENQNNRPALQFFTAAKVALSHWPACLHSIDVQEPEVLSLRAS